MKNQRFVYIFHAFPCPSVPCGPAAYMRLHSTPMRHRSKTPGSSDWLAITQPGSREFGPNCRSPASGYRARLGTLKENGRAREYSLVPADRKGNRGWACGPDAQVCPCRWNAEVRHAAGIG